MSELLLTISTGWTERLGPFTLRAADLPVSLSGLSVALILTRPDGTSVTPGGAVVVDPDQVTNKGKVYYDPVAGDFTWSTGRPTIQDYRLRWQITDGVGKVYTFPNGEADIIRVVRA
jgi:hypothetical protein